MEQVWFAFWTGVLGPFESIAAGRLVLTMVLCGLVGLERSGHERASGCRPHILVGVGACLQRRAERLSRIRC
jgi:hypothetical protein